MRLEFRRNADLRGLSTFRLPARARELVTVEHPGQLPAALDSDDPLLLLGGGSNTVFLEDFPGRVVINRLRGIVPTELDDQRVQVTAGAGEDWHGLVRWSMDRGLSGLENLALIPGSVGAAPMQNIGAYGAELADVLASVTAWDRSTRSLVELSRDECRFGYRSSRFKTDDRDRFVITRVALNLSRDFHPETGYQSLADELARTGITRPDSRQLAAAVMRVRRHRLPDPGRLPNAGSFFKNPVVTFAQAEALARQHPALPLHPQQDQRVKLSAGWMIDHLGWRGRRHGDAAVYNNHALVLVNRGHATGRDLIALAEAIQSDVVQAFGVRLEPEPRLVGLPEESLLHQPTS